MKQYLKKGTLTVLFLSLISTVVLFSCSRGDTMCVCRTFAPVASNNFLLGKGKRISWDQAYKDCQDIQHNTRWDSCTVLEIR